LGGHALTAAFDPDQKRRIRAVRALRLASATAHKSILPWKPSPSRATQRV